LPRPRSSLEAVIRETLAGIDPHISVADLMSFDEQVSHNFNQDGLMARLAAIFGLPARALASIGPL
jgi:hypothetical protein